MIAQPGVQLGSRDREMERARGRMRVDRKRAPVHRVGAGSQRAPETDDHLLAGIEAPVELVTETAEKAVTTPWVYQSLSSCTGPFTVNPTPGTA